MGCMKMKIPESEIEQARQADLAEYLRMCGYNLKREGRSYRVTDFYGGMVVTGNKWFWQAEQVGGKSIDFLTNILHMSFRTAVQALNDVPAASESDIYMPHTIAMSDCTYTPVEIPEKANDNRRIIAYLCQRRNIRYDIVMYLIQANKLYQDTMGNCVFVIHNENGCLIGAESHGTGYTRYKRSTRHTGYGFTLHCGRNPTGAMFFESAIDLLSYYQIYESELTHHDLVSIAGIGNDATIRQYHQRHPDNKICICSDNDDAGDRLIVKIRSELDCKIYIHRPQNCHDWNDVLLN